MIWIIIQILLWNYAIVCSTQSINDNGDEKILKRPRGRHSYSRPHIRRFNYTRPISTEKYDELTSTSGVDLMGNPILILPPKELKIPTRKPFPQHVGLSLREKIYKTHNSKDNDMQMKSVLDNTSDDFNENTKPRKKVLRKKTLRRKPQQVSLSTTPIIISESLNAQNENINEKVYDPIISSSTTLDDSTEQSNIPFMKNDVSPTVGLKLRRPSNIFNKYSSNDLVKNKSYDDEMPQQIKSIKNFESNDQNSNQGFSHGPKYQMPSIDQKGSPISLYPKESIKPNTYDNLDEVTPSSLSIQSSPKIVDITPYPPVYDQYDGQKQSLPDLSPPPQLFKTPEITQSPELMTIEKEVSMSSPYNAPQQNQQLPDLPQPPQLSGISANTPQSTTMGKKVSISMPYAKQQKQPLSDMPPPPQLFELSDMTQTSESITTEEKVSMSTPNPQKQNQWLPDLPPPQFLNNLALGNNPQSITMEKEVLMSMPYAQRLKQPLLDDLPQPALMSKNSFSTRKPESITMEHETSTSMPYSQNQYKFLSELQTPPQIFKNPFSTQRPESITVGKKVETSLPYAPQQNHFFQQASPQTIAMEKEFSTSLPYEQQNQPLPNLPVPPQLFKNSVSTQQPEKFKIEKEVSMSLPTEQQERQSFPNEPIPTQFFKNSVSTQRPESFSVEEELSMSMPYKQQQNQPLSNLPTPPQLFKNSVSTQQPETFKIEKEVSMSLPYEQQESQPFPNISLPPQIFQNSVSTQRPESLTVEKELSMSMSYEPQQNQPSSNLPSPQQLFKNSASTQRPKTFTIEKEVSMSMSNAQNQNQLSLDSSTPSEIFKTYFSTTTPQSTTMEKEALIPIPYKQQPSSIDLYSPSKLIKMNSISSTSRPITMEKDISMSTPYDDQPSSVDFPSLSEFIKTPTISITPLPIPSEKEIVTSKPYDEKPLFINTQSSPQHNQTPYFSSTTQSMSKEKQVSTSIPYEQYPSFVDTQSSSQRIQNPFFWTTPNPTLLQKEVSMAKPFEQRPLSVDLKLPSDFIKTPSISSTPQPIEKETSTSVSYYKEQFPIINFSSFSTRIKTPNMVSTHRPYTDQKEISTLLTGEYPYNNKQNKFLQSLPLAPQSIKPSGNIKDYNYMTYQTIPQQLSYAPVSPTLQPTAIVYQGDMITIPKPDDNEEAIKPLTPLLPSTIPIKPPTFELSSGRLPENNPNKERPTVKPLVTVPPAHEIVREFVSSTKPLLNQESISTSQNIQKPLHPMSEYYSPAQSVFVLNKPAYIKQLYNKNDQITQLYPKSLTETISTDSQFTRYGIQINDDTLKNLLADETRNSIELGNENLIQENTLSLTPRLNYEKNEYKPFRLSNPLYDISLIPPYPRPYRFGFEFLPQRSPAYNGHAYSYSNQNIFSDSQPTKQILYNFESSNSMFPQKEMLYKSPTIETSPFLASSNFDLMRSSLNPTVERSAMLSTDSESSESLLASLMPAEKTISPNTYLSTFQKQLSTPFNDYASDKYMNYYDSLLMDKK